MTLADEDTNSIPTNTANMAFQGNVVMQVTQPGGQLCKWRYLVAKFVTICKWRHMVAKFVSNAMFLSQSSYASILASRIFLKFALNGL